MRNLPPLALLLVGCGGSSSSPDALAKLVRYPKTVTVSRGEAAEFSVEAAGKDLTYRWFHAGREIPGADVPALRIPSVDAGDFGEYTVEVVQGERREGASAELRETGFPDFVSEAQGPPVDGTVTFGFVAKGDPAPTYQWAKDRGDGLYEPIEGATGTTLTVPVPIYGHGAGYEVYATNRKGSVMDIFLVQTP